MSDRTFALTKIQPPRLRSALIARPGLEERLGDALASSRLTLLSAPAGYGKTAALTRQLGALPEGTAVAWVALDEDDDLGRVASCLVAALEGFDLPWRASPEALVLAMQDGARSSRQAFAAALLNALAATELPRGLLVFDDTHRVTDPAVFELFDNLIERLPLHWGMVLAGRTDPPLALPKLRAQGDCSELRQDELGFSPDDVRTLMRSRQSQSHQQPSDDEVRAVHERTQGWPAGLGLVLSDTARRGVAPSGSLRDRHVFDYLASEVLDDMPTGLRDFLLRCAVLPELTAERCAIVSGDPQAAQRLEEIERRGLFASVLDSEVHTLRLHDLFRDCLDDRLRRERPHELAGLLSRAADTEPDPVRRIHFLLRAGDWTRAECTLAELAPQMLTRGNTAAMLMLFSQFPAEHRDHSPTLQLVRAMASWGQWDLGPMRDGALRAVEGFAQRGDELHRRRALSYLAVAYSSTDDDTLAQQTVDTLLALPLDDDALSRTLLVASWLALPRDCAQLATLWSRQMDTLERLNSLDHWYECSPLPGFIGLPGMREPLLRNVAGVQRCLPEQPVPLSGMIQVTQGWLHLWAGQWQAVERALERAESDCRWLGQPTGLRWQLHMLRALLLAVRGDVAGSRDAATVLTQETQALAGATERAAYVGRLAHYAQRVAMIAGDDERALALSTQLDQHRHDADWFMPPAFSQAADAYAAAVQEHWARACTIWTTLVENEIRIDVFGQAVETRLRLAAGQLRLRRPDLAAQALLPVFERLHGGQEFGIALGAGPQVLGELAAAPWGGLLSPSQQQSLHDWATAALSLRGQTVAPPAPKSTKDELLSPREHEVLQRMAAGDSNKLIARAFDLSPHTVKRHVANILDKLDLSTRGQAAAWMREHEGKASTPRGSPPARG